MPLPTPLSVELLQSIVTTIDASLFIDLHDWKDGPDADLLADIFA